MGCPGRRPGRSLSTTDETPPPDWTPAAGPARPSRITFLEMTSRPAPRRAPPPLDAHALMRVEEPAVAYFRWLYHHTGRDWMWIDRRRWDDEKLAAHLTAPGYALYVLYLKGGPAGFFELVPHDGGTRIDLGLFGIMPEYIGRKLGPFMLDQAIQLGWERGPNRMTVDTCTLDHPRALTLYQKFGFTPYATRERLAWPLGPSLAGLD